MKKTILTSLSLMAALILTSCGSQRKETVSVEIFNEGLRYCESTYSYEGGILIANFGSTQLDPLNTEGKGYIVRYKDGASEVLIPADGNLSGPRGMYLRDGRLFICDVNKIVVYNLSNREEAPRVIALPEGEAFVNDLAAEGNSLYASVTNTGHIFRLDITDPAQPGEPELWLEIAGPNGLVIRDGAMYVACYSPDGQARSEHVIYRIADLQNPVAEPFVTVPGQYDGIAFSGDGKSLYVTNWAPAGISRIDMQTREITPVELPLEQPLIGPADMTVAEGKIYVPDLPNSRVVIFEE
ncbi:hypothetical protein B5E60_03790 [Alistipes sp. An116]|uniref:SMP-30/gluconolactonase/LRE family protein n=1 Tax=Alistipes sp. An116 TaxID=1965546 RepID=UPI000B37BE9C|nr:hypothetical protein [Alistipes sp. An116]OUQ54047.1 hypothetical protein B5E60_03790 [Alistipes sp. An116]